MTCHSHLGLTLATFANTCASQGQATIDLNCSNFETEQQLLETKNICCVEAKLLFSEAKTLRLKVFWLPKCQQKACFPKTLQGLNLQSAYFRENAIL